MCHSTRENRTRVWHCISVLNSHHFHSFVAVNFPLIFFWKSLWWVSLYHCCWDKAFLQYVWQPLFLRGVGSDVSISKKEFIYPSLGWEWEFSSFKTRGSHGCQIQWSVQKTNFFCVEDGTRQHQEKEPTNWKWFSHIVTLEILNF